LPTDSSTELAIPLARWFDRKLDELARTTGCPAIGELSGETLMAERIGHKGLTVPGRISAGNGSRLLRARDGWIAMTLSRPVADRELLPALFGDADFAVEDDAAIAAGVAAADCEYLLSLGRDLGMAIATVDETPASPPVEVLAEGQPRRRAADHVPLVVDLSGLWAGPLAGHFFHLAGARVVKVESSTRPDNMRNHDIGFYTLINQGKDSVTLDFTDPPQRDALIALLRRADIVIEAARPRALLQLGIDAAALVREVPGLVWLTVTGHGASGDAAHWVGIGHDCGVAGGLTKALFDATGEVAFVGDAIADPLTGLVAAIEGWRAYAAGEARRIGFSLSAVSALALTEERAHDPAALEADLRAWRSAEGQPFPYSRPRQPQAALRPFGADNALWLGETAAC